MHDFMKTILSAMKEWVNKKIKNNTPNWNENDPEADGYIKNRPFYTKETSKILVDNVSVEITVEGNPSINMLTLDNITEGQTYNIIWDDIEYDCVGYIAEGPNAPSIGNGTLAGVSGGNGEPFFITVFQGASLLLAEVGTHRISIATNSIEVKKISKEYLPDNFEVPNSNLVNGQYSFGSLRTIMSAEESEGDYIVGTYAFAEGSQTKASGESSHAEGTMTTASGYYSHAEGVSTIANGSGSHAEGVSTIANGSGSHAEGLWTIANGGNQHVQGRHNIADEEGNYAHIVGNGMWEEQLSNAHTLDWSGNAWFSGDVYVGSTSGTNRDEGSKKLATEDFVTAALTALGLPVPTAADAGKILRVNAQGKYELVSIANAEEATF